MAAAAHGVAFESVLRGPVAANLTALLRNGESRLTWLRTINGLYDAEHVHDSLHSAPISRISQRRGLSTREQNGLVRRIQQQLGNPFVPELLTKFILFVELYVSSQFPPVAKDPAAYATATTLPPSTSNDSYWEWMSVLLPAPAAVHFAEVIRASEEYAAFDVAAHFD